MNVDELVAIDVHVHLEHDAQPTDTDEAARKYFGKGVAAQGAQALADYYRSRKMACVVFTVDEQVDRPSARDERRHSRVRRRECRHRDSVRQRRSRPAAKPPWRKPDGLSRPAPSAASSCTRRCSSSSPTIALAYPVYEVFAEAKLPVLFHTGHSGIGTGMRGGGGVRLKYGNPMHIDDVAVDFPDMPIILAHPSFPWQDEAISVCMHKPQVYIDLVRLVAEVLLADARAVREHAAQAQGPVRIRLPVDHAGSLAGGLRQDRHS